MLKVSADFIDARVARLATCSAAGQPHCVPVCFAFCDPVFVVALDEKPKKVDVLRLKRVRNVLENPQVSLLVDHYEEDWSRLRFWMLEGTARLRELQARELEALRAKYPQYALHQLKWGLAIEGRRMVSWTA
ncbi:MAG: TIGR03668 family PPOX class F420-dependent oxidoreductase [Candidatus Eremiobacteraeota bacterium]|nr:TIGR03668 family PPOX class F420-dependent oxidoreductase [Candidatus Eremiobacteraeota bacterium]MCW5872424.1 TIGR03668 family PPOX class F420-dependent oxidoreductase [Candidatus Eremiobacteraeota bacterium]